MTPVTTDTRTPLWAMSDEQLRFVASDDTAEWDRRCVAESLLGERAELPLNVDLSLYHEGWKAGVVYAVFGPLTYAPVYDDSWLDGFLRGREAVAADPDLYVPVRPVPVDTPRRPEASWAPVP